MTIGFEIVVIVAFFLGFYLGWRLRHVAHRLHIFRINEEK
jgi:hypothetical protein